MRILCVCLGNICRSPTAEAVIRSKAGAAHVVDSAGTSDWHIGSPPYGPAVAAAAARGYDLSALRARQVESADFTRFDLILAMDGDNLRTIEALRPPENSTPVVRFLDFARVGAPRDLPDPYYTRGFEETLTLIEQATDGLLTALEKGWAD